LPLLLILASASPRRLDLLRQIGLEPSKVDPADTDETPRAAEPPRAYALRMAEAKLAIVAARHPGALVLAADSVVAVGRRILPKAENEAEARQCLALLSGRRHRVLGAIAVGAHGKTKRRLVETAVRFKRLDGPRSRPTCKAASGRARPAAMPSRAAPLRSSPSSQARTATWSACRCSRRPPCCARWARYDAAQMTCP